MAIPVVDRPAHSISGYLAAIGSFVLIVASMAYAMHIAMLWPDVTQSSVLALFCAIIMLAVGVILLLGIYVLQPNQSAVLTLFGSYAGTDSQTGLRWANPLLAKNKVSCRLQTRHIETIKVNDASGNPIEIGATIVWHIVNPAKAILVVGDYNQFVELQSETALRKTASSHPYDHWQDGREETSEKAAIVSLRDGGEEITLSLADELRSRLFHAGVEVVDARITHLAYAPEIASAMLRRQQASAIVAARRTIVKGAVDLVKEALNRLEDKSIEIDNERKAAMVSNMLIVLVGDKDAVPVINTGTLYG